MEHTREALNRRIWDRVQEGESIHEAVEAIHAEIAAKPAELRAWWNALGLYWLKETERDGRRLGSEPLAVDGPDSSWKPPANFGTKWTDRVDPLSIFVSVGSSGIQKPAGDLTKADVAVCVDFHRSSAEAHTLRQRQWLVFANKMKDTETIRDVVNRVPALADSELPWVKSAVKLVRPDGVAA
jgi:hypothetical protein